MPGDQTDPLGHGVPLGMSPTRHGAHPAPPNVGTATAAMRTPLPLCHPSRHLKVPFWGARALIFPIWLFLFSALQLLGCSKAAPLGPCPSVTAVWGQGDVWGGGPGALCLLLAPALALGLGPSQPQSIPQSGAAPGGCVFGESSSTDATERHRHATDVPRARSRSSSVPARAAGGVRGERKNGAGQQVGCAPAHRQGLQPCSSSSSFPKLLASPLHLSATAPRFHLGKAPSPTLQRPPQPAEAQPLPKAACSSLGALPRGFVLPPARVAASSSRAEPSGAGSPGTQLTLLWQRLPELGKTRAAACKWKCPAEPLSLIHI